MTLIKSNSHGSGLEVHRNSEYVRKFSMTDTPNPALEREVEGYKWIGERYKYKDGILTVPRHRGREFPQYNGITGNEEWLRRLTQYYVKEWRTRKYAVHGDLCLCNVVFGNHVHIIDWEHFHYADKKFFGFDIINALFIHLQYQYRWLTYWGINWVPFIRPKVRDFIWETVQLLGDSGFLRKPFTNSHWYIRKYMNKDKFILGKQSEEVIESLDDLCV